MAQEVMVTMAAKDLVQLIHSPTDTISCTLDLVFASGKGHHDLEFDNNNISPLLSTDHSFLAPVPGSGAYSISLIQMPDGPSVVSESAWTGFVKLWYIFG